MAASVLIVEDNALNGELMEYLLRAHGFVTLRAVDGRIGLDVARRERPDLILCDIEMPSLDGFGFAREAKADAALRATPLVAVTAYAMVGDRERILAAGFDGYVSKPIEPQAFIAIVAPFIPAEAMPLRAAGAAAAAPVAHDGPAPLVLVLDDSPFNLELKRDLLEPSGYHVVTASTPREAWRLVREQPPALIISDVGMTEGSGFDFLRQVKADPALCKIPFMFLSSTHWDEASEMLALELGAQRYLRRPMEPPALLAEIRSALGR